MSTHSSASPRLQSVLSGLRPTGRVHLGNYFGAIRNWVDLQDRYRCHYFVADWHALTSDYADTSRIAGATRDAVLDWLAAGLDPERSVIFVQSWVKEVAELHLLLSNLTPLGWLERVPTYKDQIAQITTKDLANYGFLGYPVLQTADIVVYKGELVPVGEDQASHIEISREIVRRFNQFFRRKDGGEILPEPKALFTPTPKVPGLDGRKMSKSYDNTISLVEPADSLAPKIRSMVTDPKRARRNDPGEPNDCNLYPFHRLFTPAERLPEIEAGCRSASLGCVDCKKMLIGTMNEGLEPIRQRRSELELHPDRVDEILAAGTARARSVAHETMEEVREATGLLLPRGREE
jgi:tryptophanyl-tRNA synthetase